MGKNQDTEEKTKKVIQKLKAENRDLKKKIKAARRELKQISYIPLDEEVEYIEEVLEDTEGVNEALICEKCDSAEVLLIPAGIFNILRCTECDFKRRLDK